ncbi:MAG: N-acetyl-gamma-glutamyl-phosphate reductase [Chthoniobacterales bacterium]|nr:N-acetyl-gamma-glutamyl-phosphate reductase [Chthoniobacterales bacterium]MCX7713731.1 N-acetyl-gamma-glutamyl-phosphate reductase [Chthoniobacterales bacterium]
MQKPTIRAAIVGASGYSGQELLRLLLPHPNVQIVSITSRQFAGKPLAEAFPAFASLPSSQITFSQPEIQALLNSDADVFFLALPHGAAAEFALPLFQNSRKVIDLSADFRIRNPESYLEFYGHPHPAPELLPHATYGLPEIYYSQIQKSSLIASPGCYPTSILLALIPLIKNKLILPKPIFVSSSSGTSGAGKKADESLLFSEIYGSVRSYSIPKHRHLAEIEQELTLAAGIETRITFVPHLVPINRGIHTTIFTQPSSPSLKEEDFFDALKNAYKNSPFIRIRHTLPDTKFVANSNFCDISLRLDTRTNSLILLSSLDNLTKGAAGQAIQSMNILFALPQSTGFF